MIFAIIKRIILKARKVSTDQGTISEIFVIIRAIRGKKKDGDLFSMMVALREGCPRPVTFNLRHYRPGHPQVTVLQPGELIPRVRDRLAGLAAQESP